MREGAIVAENKRVRLPRYVEWQRTKSPRVRLFARETPAFAKLGAFSRMYAAEFVRRANRDGVFAEGSPATVASMLSIDKGERMSSAARAAYRDRIHTRILELALDGFLTADYALRVRNYVTAQEARKTQDDRRHAPKRPPAPENPQGTLPGRWGDVARTLGGRCPDVAEPEVREIITQEACFPSRPVPTREEETLSESPAEVPDGTPSAPSGGESRESVSRPLPEPQTTPTDHGHAAPTPPTDTRPPRLVVPPSNPAPLGDPMQGTLFPLAPVPNATLASPPPTPASAHAASADAPERADTPAAPPSARKAASRAKAAKPAKAPAVSKDNPMPFPVEDALKALATAANGRFVVGHSEDWQTFTARNITAKIRKFGDIARWKLVGEWLAATSSPFAAPLTPDWAGSNSLNSAMVNSRAWHETGRVLQRPTPEIRGVLAKAVPQGPLPVAPDSAWEEATRLNRAVGHTMFGE